MNEFNIWNYLVKSNDKSINPNFRSLGNTGGNFFIPHHELPNLYNYVVNNKFSRQYCLSDLKTDYYILPYDLDIKESNIQHFQQNNINMPKFWQYIINKIKTIE